MTTTLPEILLALLALLVGGVVGFILGAWWVSRRPRPDQPGGLDATQAQQLRVELAQAETRAASLESQVQAHELRDQDTDRIRDLLIPLAQQVTELGTTVSRLEHDRATQFGTLSAQLKHAATTDEALMRNTQALVHTLKATSARGHWGEVQLRRVVEAAGMLRHVDFSEQVRFASAHSGARGQRPDMVITLPGNKIVILDAKAPLSAVLAAEELADDFSDVARTRRAELAAEHARAVRSHVDQLATKQYWAASPELNTPEFVMCFLPAESYLAAAVETDPELLDYAFSKNVVLVSPVSLFSSLKAIARAWQQESLVDNAREIYQAATTLHERIRTVTKYLADLGSSLNASVTAFNKVIGSVESRLLPATRRMTDLDVSGMDPITAPARVETTTRQPAGSVGVRAREGHDQADQPDRSEHDATDQ